MTSSTNIIIERKKISRTSSTRRIGMGIFFLALAALIFFLFLPSTMPDEITTYGMVPGGIKEGVMGDWVVNSQLALYITCGLIAALAVFQLVRGFGKFTNPVLALVCLLFVFAFLTDAAAGKGLNLVGVLRSTLLLSVPIILGAFSGVLSERGGVVNIGIEGMMLMGAMVGAVVGSITKSSWLGLIGSILSCEVLALVLGVLSIKYKVNQIISGTVINIFATGITTYLSEKILQPMQYLNQPPMFTRVPIPLLANIPILGPVLFNQNIFVYAMFILLAVLQIALFSTRWGLRLRSVGEHPKAADTLGINVIRTRYMAVLLSGAMAGLAGAYFTLGSVGRFDEVMTSGKGFIGLAAMIFGNWTPVGSFFAGLLFGFADTLGSKLQILGSVIPPQIMATLPYIATMVALAGVVGRGHTPAADGEPYEKE
jgi:general nucleoside transport system permease protein